METRFLNSQPVFSLWPTVLNSNQNVFHVCYLKLCWNLFFRRGTKKEEFQDQDLLGDNDEIDEMTLRLDNLTREIEKAKARQKIMMGSVDQQRDILLAVAEHVGVEVNLPTRVKLE